MTIANSKERLTTGIGSLPHHNIDAALGFSFRTEIPFLPQIPIRNSWEYMIPQSLEGLPGLEVDASGAVMLDLNVWTGRSRALAERLKAAFARSHEDYAFESFEPSSASSSSWQPFLWELAEQGAKTAKIQLAGPLTCQWTLKAKDGTSLLQERDLSTQIFQLVLARALGMCRRLKLSGISPILFLDEPGLFAWTRSNPSHVMALQELKLLIQTLQKEGAQVGIHCCSDADWDAILGLGMDWLSIDAELSFSKLVTHGTALLRFVGQGGRLALGIIPTTTSDGHALSDLQAPELIARLLDRLKPLEPSLQQELNRILPQSLLTPACGLALHSTSEAETVLSLLQDVRKAWLHT